MKYSFETHKKTLQHLIKHTPHDIESIKKLYEAASDLPLKPKVDIYDILFSTVWSAEEKIELMKLYEYEKHHKFTYKTYERDMGYSYGIEGLPLVDECIRKRTLSGVQALLRLGAHISEATIPRIIEYIKDPDERYMFCETIVNHYTNQDRIMVYRGNGNQCYLVEIPSLCDRYPHNISSDQLWRLVTSMEEIIPTNDLRLIKLFIPTIKDITPLLDYAAKFGTPASAGIFIENGADVNYQERKFQYDNNGSALKTPLKVAIDNNDLEMIKLLHKNGADLNFVDSSDEITGFAKTLKDDSHDKQYLFDWTYAPLEYSINLGPASLSKIFYIQACFNTKPDREKHDNSKKLKDRVEIVKYLYENGAKFTNGTINYTDLISFSVLAKDARSTRYFLEEAKKNNYIPDFQKIITFIYGQNQFVGTGSSQSFDINEIVPLFATLYEYSKILDAENHLTNTQVMLKTIIDKMSQWHYYFERFKTLITQMTKELAQDTTKNLLQQIPAIFNAPFEDLEYFLSIGYDIHQLDKDGNSILMEYVKNGASNEEILKLISMGANVNHQVPVKGFSALSCAIFRLPKYEFGEHIRYFDQKTKQLSPYASNIGEEEKLVIKTLTELSSAAVIKSKAVEEAVYHAIAPEYAQIIYSDVLSLLSKKGFVVSDNYFTKSLDFIKDEYEYLDSQQESLRTLYEIFPNKAVGTNLQFPQIETVKNYKGKSLESKRCFKLVRENIERTFVTSIKQLKEPDTVMYDDWDIINLENTDYTKLMKAKDELLMEIIRYVGFLPANQILSLIDRYPILDINLLFSSSEEVYNLLSVAIQAQDTNLCKGLIKRGATIVYYDKDGHDVTSRLFSKVCIHFFLKLGGQYNPYKEQEELLSEIGAVPSDGKDIDEESSGFVKTIACRESTSADYKEDEELPF